MSDDKEINPYEPPKSDLMVQARRISYAVVVVLVLLVWECVVLVCQQWSTVTRLLHISYLVPQ